MAKMMMEMMEMVRMMGRIIIEMRAKLHITNYIIYLHHCLLLNIIYIIT